MFNILKASSFACDRTCRPGFLCLFAPIFAALGPSRVVSHTTKVEVQLQDQVALEAAILAMGGTIIGQGTHAMYSGYGNQDQVGFGFTLPNWQYPLTLRADNSLAFDDFNGRWGNKADITKLTGLYAVQAARIAAEAQGWMVEMQESGAITIYHPDGGTITVSQDGTVDAANFVGTGCDASKVIELSIGRAGERVDKPEYGDPSVFLQLQ